MEFCDFFWHKIYRLTLRIIKDFACSNLAHNQILGYTVRIIKEWHT